MPFDFAPSQQKRDAGLVAYNDGLAAEDAVAAFYCARGHAVLARRWRGKAGEIDLVLEGDDGLVFVEVKKARTHADAATRLSDRQLHRIALAGEEYVGRECDDPFTAMRLDLAMVDGAGRIEILENLPLY